MIIACLSALHFDIKGENVRKLIGSILMSVAALALAPQAAVAAPVVAAGSTYSVYLDRDNSNEAFHGIAAFDGISELGAWEFLPITVSESETDLGNGRSLISIQLRANGDFFPMADESGYYGIGTFGDGLDLLRSVFLYDARVSFLDSNNKLVTDSGNLVDNVGQSAPWDGFFPTADGIFHSESLGGLGILGINFDFFVSEEPVSVPEPTGVLLTGLGLMAMLATRRRRSR